jgi:hypothetical protein
MRKLTLLGPLAAVLLLGGLFENNIETSSSDGSIRDWLASTGNATWLGHAVAEALAGTLLVLFAQVVRARLSRDADDETDSVLGRSVGALGTVLGVMVVVGAGLFAAVPVGRVFEGAPDPDPSSYRYLLSAAASVFVIFLSIPAAAFAATTSALGLRTGTMPRWLGWTGLVLAALMLLSAFVAPLMVFGLWLVLTGLALAVQRESQPSSSRPRAPEVAVP